LTSDQGFTVTSDQDTGLIGFRVHAVGDINNDGLDDFAVSAPFFEDDLTPFPQGTNFIVFGSEDAPGVTNEDGVSVLNLSDFSAVNGVRIIGSDPETDTDALSVTSIGDFNGDGVGDLLVGSPDFFSGRNGQAYVVFGSEMGVGTDDGNGNLILDVSTLTAETGIILDGRFGQNTAFFITEIDDFNGDGFTDIIIGSAGNNFDGSNGSAFIVYGGSNVGELTENNQRVIDLPDLNALQGFEFRGQEDLDNVGFAISSAGDVNGDGLPDIIINTSDAVESSSSAVVIFGVPSVAGEVDGREDPGESLALVQENTTAAFVATSLGEGTVFTLGGDDAALFEINQETGLVSFIEAPDFEAILSDARFSSILNEIDDPEDLEDFGFDLEIMTVNGDLSAIQEVAITVTDVNEFAPEFITDDTLASSNGSFILRATDADGTPIQLIELSQGGLGFDDALSYEITGGADADLFNLEVVSGDSGFAGILSFLSVPAVDMPVDADGDGIYDVELTVSDGELTTTQSLSLTLVEGGADPVFSGPVDFSIDELGETFVGALSAEDPDGAEVGYIIARSDADDSGLFAIDFFTGELSFIETPSFTTPRDMNFDNVYELTVIAVDGSDASFQTVAVTVNDVEFAPTIVTGLQTEFSENGPISLTQFSFNGLLIAQDLDFDDITASITGGADASFFTIVENDFTFREFQGFDLTTEEIFDFENPVDANGDNIYEVEITFSDGVNETVETLEFTIFDVFESPNAPVFTTPSTVQVNEGEQFILNVNADDADGETPTYSITGGDDAFVLFIDSDTGDLSFFDAIRFNQPGDFNDNVYTVEVTADDGSSNQTTQTIVIEVVDVDFAPEFFHFCQCE